MAAQEMLTINGQLFSSSGELLPFLKIALFDSEGSYGLISYTYASEKGSFAFVLTQPATDMIRSGKLIPEYRISLGETLLLKESRPYEEGDKPYEFRIEEGLYREAQQALGDEYLFLRGNALLSDKGEPLSNVRIELVDATGGYPYLISHTITDREGNLSFSIPPELAVQVREGKIQPEFDFYIGDILFEKQPVRKQEEFLSLRISSAGYFEALNRDVAPLQRELPGEVLLQDSREPAANVQVELSAAKESDTGSLYSAVTDDAGNFNLRFLDVVAFWSSNNRLAATADVSVKGINIGSYPVDLKDKATVFVNDEAYKNATGGGEQPDFRALVQNITANRINLSAVSRQLSSERAALRLDENNLVYASENSLDIQPIRESIRRHDINIRDLEIQHTRLQDIDVSLTTQLWSYYNTQEYAVSQLDDHVPILFFPVRLETIFQESGGAKQLWVRIFPDDIAVETHEESLTQSEVEQGKLYWVSTVNAVDLVAKQQAWDVLSRSFGARRAAWVALQTMPTVMPPTLPPATPVEEADLVWPAFNIQDASWTQQPITRVLPDAFVIIGYTGTDYHTPAFSVQTKLLPDEVKVGFDPSNEDSFDQSGGDLTLDASNADIDWMIDFNAAINKGLGIKINIDDNAYNNGFTRIIALGVKASLTKELSQQRLENLIKSHHYTDGFALLKQGTSTNNTDEGPSGYSSVDMGNHVTYATEREGNLFAPVTAIRNKPDGQILCDALGIDYSVLYHIFHSNGYDIRDAMNMNSVLWQISLGNYVMDQLNPLVSSSTADQLRGFFADFVRSRGALPSIRSGIQPYGILPASVYSRINWSTNPNTDLYSHLHHLAETFDVHWASAARNVVTARSEGFAAQGLSARSMGADNVPPATQKLLDIIAQHPVSVDRVQRIGVGAGYIWNNLVYADREGRKRQEWLSKQRERMAFVDRDLGLNLSPRPKIMQTNFFNKQSPLPKPMVTEVRVNQDKPMPPIGNSEMNYLHLLSKAKFSEIRDERYERYRIDLKQIPDTMLYRFARQSLMLEYFDTACKLLKIPDDQRVEPELANMRRQGKEQQPMARAAEGTEFSLYTGPSRWAVMDTPYEGFATVADYIDSQEAIKRPEVANVLDTRQSMEWLADRPVRSLGALTAEVMDATSFRLDTWKLALVNQRLNAIRGIAEGSSERNMGIYLGAYSWLENVKKATGVTNQGYLFAPSLGQAATAAVLRSGYVTRADADTASPLSVNISSERVRSALDILEGIRNGQPLTVMLGYEFEKRMYNNHSYGVIIDPFIDELRLAFPLKTTLTGYNQQGQMTPIQADNVMDGLALINAYKSANSNVNVLLQANDIDPNTYPLDVKTAIGQETDWLMNIMDATGDLTTAEGVFQLVQGNQTRSSAVTDAVSKGRNIPEIQMLNTPKTGLSIYQRMTMHFDLDSALPPTWTFPAGGPHNNPAQRSSAEPYLNRWIAQILGDPNQICCNVKNLNSNTTVEVSLAELHIQPMDFVYMTNDELKSDDSELSLRIKRFVRATETWGRGINLEIDFEHTTATDALSFQQVLPVVRHLKKLITTCRHLTTKDYITPTDAEDVVNQYDLADYHSRTITARTMLDVYRNALDGAYNALTTTSGFQALRDALIDMSSFGFDRTIYEYEDQTAEDYHTLKEYAASVLNAADQRIAQYNTIGVGTVLDPPDDDDYIDRCLRGLKAIFGREFNALPLFTLRAQEAATLSNQLSGNSTLLDDHAGNDFLTDEWVSGISKVRRNVANYELLTILASTINLDAFTSDRSMVPLQVPYATDGTERWLGAQVNVPADSLKDGRTSFGVSIPGDPVVYDVTAPMVGIMIDEWIDVVPNKAETAGVAFHYNQPNARPPQCLLLGLTPDITGHWQWADLVDMINETLDLAQKRAVTYEDISDTSVGQLSPTFVVAGSERNVAMGFTERDIIAKP